MHSELSVQPWFLFCNPKFRKQWVSHDLIESKKNGEISNNIDDMPNKLKIMLDNHSLYSLNTFQTYLKSDLFMPDLVQNIQFNYNKKING